MAKNFLDLEARMRAEYVASGAAAADQAAEAEQAEQARIAELRHALFHHRNIARSQAAEAAEPHALLEMAARNLNRDLVIALVEVGINRRDRALVEAGASYFEEGGAVTISPFGGPSYNAAPRPVAGWIRELWLLTV